MQPLECDVLVIGSGASGLAAAVTAAHHGQQVIVAEKASQLGGTSAWSGGWLWIPRNPLAIAEGIVETDDAPERYRARANPRQRTGPAPARLPAPWPADGGVSRRWSAALRCQAASGESG
ncbi:fumarate reductase/succinate dehydrogenase flavoprotein domain-containing protein [Pseudomonas putida S11]|nr:fumarate reductase/succinate dehydrogenase flavoprotein domain-containing protein [Pseudomonas putida S11]